ncbi:ATPase [Amaricoccus macauensis]|uniref:ATPase n=1 Tax=Amaricoccus macauensis TaxID=57001 RepID=UPI003C7E7897
MLYETPKDWLGARHKRVALFGMSGLGKTRLSAMLREEAEWFHYSVDFRIGTRYMGEHIVDNFKHEAMRNPYLRRLLLTDSIYIASNISFHNLEPLSAYLGKPGNPDLGGIPFEEYLHRQRQHRDAEIAATRDALLFIRKANEIYGYDNFVCDTSGSLCEIVDPEADDQTMATLTSALLPVWIRGTEAHLDLLARRFDRAPKPMYYSEPFLLELWERYLAEQGEKPDEVDPDEFIRHGYRALLDHRLPRYQAIADRWGVTVDAMEAGSVRDPEDFDELIAAAIARRNEG